MPSANQRVMISILAQPDTAAIRTAEFGGEQYTVVPVVMLNEGVLWPGNAESPELALAEEFGRFPQTWDGRPVVLDHPRVNGDPVSANSPAILEQYAFGQLFNTRLDNKKLLSEMWIHNARVDELGQDFQDVLTSFKSGEKVMEVSTGLFSVIEHAPGVYNGQKFEGIWRDIVPDHLAVLPEGIVGACSVEGGCGAPRLNSDSDTLTLGDGAIANFSSFHLSEMSDTLTLGDGGCSCEDPTNCQCDKGTGEQRSLFKALQERFKDLITFKFRDLATISDTDTRAALRQALNQESSFFWIVAVFNSGNNQGQVVWEDYADGTLYMQTFSIDGGKITLSGNKQQVRPETQFVPVEVVGNSSPTTNSTQEESAVKIEEIVSALITNKATQYEESDREWLMTLNEEQLTKMAPVEATPNDPPAGDPPADDPEPSVQQQNRQAAQPAEPRVLTTDEYVANAPAEMQEVLKEGLKLQKQRRTVLVEGLLENGRCRFTKEQLNAKSLDELEALAELAQIPDYSGLGPVVNQGDEDEDAPPPAPDVFDETFLTSVRNRQAGQSH